VEIASQEANLATVEELIDQLEVLEDRTAVGGALVLIEFSGEALQHLFLVLLCLRIILKFLREDVGFAKGDAEIVKEKGIDSDKFFTSHFDHI
jgi:hypothetical protein